MTGAGHCQGLRTVDKAAELFQHGASVAEVAHLLRITPKTAKGYRARVSMRGKCDARKHRKPTPDAPACPRCHLRMFTGRCDFCLPDVTEFIHRGGGGIHIHLARVDL